MPIVKGAYQELSRQKVVETIKLCTMHNKL